MKIIAVHCRDGSVDTDGARIEGEWKRRALHINATRGLRRCELSVGFAGAALAAVDAGHNVGHAAVGAIAGGVLLGPIGLIAGGAIGGKRKHTLVLASPDARVVLETTTKELQRWLALGLPFNVDAVAVAGEFPKWHRRPLTWALLVVMVVVGAFTGVWPLFIGAAGLFALST